MSLRERALALLRQRSDFGPSLEAHCERVASLTLALARRRGVHLDEDLVWAGCYLHDIGLCVPREGRARDYIRRGVEFAREATAEWPLDGVQRRILDEILLYNHAVGALPEGISEAARLTRRAVDVEHSLGVIRHGLTWSEIRAIQRCYPRGAFNKVLARFLKIALLDDGPQSLRRVLRPRSI